jgi:formate dehydrogenase (coenzyme F420) alpha subunit
MTFDSKTRKVTTLCRMCDHGCGMVVSVEKGIPVAVEGSRQHPFNRGWLCAKGRSAVEFFNSPSRLKTPMIRKGGRLVEASWEAALTYASEKMQRLRQTYGPQSLSLYYGEGIGHQEIRSYIKRFANVYGTPNFCGVGSICNTARTIAETLTFGGLSKPDIPNTRLLIVWGANPLVSHEPYPPAEIEKLKKRGGQLIVVDPRKSESARKAHLHVAVKPGTDAVLILNVLHVIFHENLWDRAFESKWVLGFHDFHETVKDQAFSPEQGQRVTGVLPEAVRSLARAYGTTKPASVFTGNGLEHHGHGVNTMRLLALLKAITGNLDVPGGDLFTPRPKLRDITAPLPEPSVPPIGLNRFPVFCRVRKEAHALSLPEAVLDGKPYPIKGMVITGGNPSLEWPESRRTEAALRALEFLMVIDIVQSPDSRHAHVILPACTFLEREEHRVNVYQNLSCITTRSRVVAPRFGLPDQRIWVELAHAMGYGEFFPWKSTVDGTDEILSSLSVSYRDVVAQGGVYEYEGRRYRKYEDSGFQTPSAKVEVHPRLLQELGFDPSPLNPAFSREPATSEEYPLVLTTGGNLLCYTHWQFRYLPKLRKMAPEASCEIHPDTALAHGLSQGDTVEVTTASGSVRVKVRLTDNIRLDTVHLPQGWEEANANVLTDMSGADPISGFPNLKSVPCRIAPIEASNSLGKIC